MTTGRNWKQASATTVALFAGLGMLSIPTYAATVASPLPYLSDVDDIVARMAHAELEKHLNLQQFTVVRRYVLTNSRMGHDAVMKVRWSYQKDSGKSFQILETQGAEGMSRKVLDRVLEAEAEAGGPNHRENSHLTAEHYEFRLLGMESLRGRPCYVLELHPRYKNRFLLNGKAWIDAGDFSAVRVEGRPSANLSFFVGKPYIVQEFQKVGEFYMASYNRSQSESRILGNSELTIEYSDYELRSIEGTRMALSHCASGGSLN